MIKFIRSLFESALKTNPSLEYGEMQTGWIIHNGKYYYLYSDGSMAANTYIGAYRVGSDGAWIVR